jgi:hypothetical protein
MGVANEFVTGSVSQAGARAKIRIRDFDVHQPDQLLRD